MRANARPLLIACSLVASPLIAAPTIDPQYGDHAVLQRGKPIVLSGDASPNQRVTVRFAGAERAVTASASGRWQAAFPSRQASGPYSISAAAADGVAQSADVKVGDVWLCSGQSNMEYPVKRALNGEGEVQGAGDADLRLLKVAQQLAGDPQERFAKPPQWQPATPDSVRDFSAACYFLTRELRASEKVPIGAIDDTWGGTPIRAWMNEASVAASGGADSAAVVELHRSNPTEALRRFGEEWGGWWRKQTGDKPGQEPWTASSRLHWKPIPSLSYWDAWGPEWKAWIGSIWARRQVTLSAAEAAQSATLSLSPIDDLDQTFVNGVAVGGRNDPSGDRRYPVPAGVLKPGLNEILVFVRNVWGQGGLAGPADKFALTFADGYTKPLTSGWQYSRIVESVGTPAVPPWEGSSGVSTIYNAMVAPLGPLGLKGVAWYQGEADVGQAGYDRRLAAWMSNWRTQFRDPQLPFLIVGLAGWGKPVSRPTESGWAALINEQRLAVGRHPRSALVSAIDLGEPNDIHPANKQEVARRLALAARRLVYRDGGTFGPLPLSAVRSGNAVAITFSKPLQILSGANANAFELCEPSGNCRYADARASGSTVTLSGDGQPVTRVRYAWSDYPLVNLYDLDLLPAPVFELPVN